MEEEKEDNAPPEEENSSDVDADSLFDIGGSEAPAGDTSSEEPAEQQAGTKSGGGEDQTSKENSDEQSADQPAEPAADQSAEPAKDQPEESAADQPEEPAADQSAEPAEDQAEGPSGDQPEEPSGDQSAEPETEQPPEESPPSEEEQPPEDGIEMPMAGWQESEEIVAEDDEAAGEDTEHGLDELPADGEEPVKKKKKKKIKKKVSKGSQEEAKEVVRAAGDFLKSAPSNLNLEEARDLLKRALSSMKLKAWSKATEYARQAQTRAEEIRDLYMNVAEEYTGLEKKFLSLHEGGISLPSLDQRFFDVQNLIRTGELDDAKEKILDLKTDLILVVPVYEDYLLINQRLQENYQNGINIPPLNARSQDVFELVNAQKLDEAKEEMKKLDEDIDLIVPVYQGYTALDERIKDFIGRAITIEGVDDKVTELIGHMNESEWEAAQDTIDEANSIIDKAIDEDKSHANEAHELMTKLYETLSSAPNYLNLDAATNKYQAAKGLFEAKSYNASLNMSKEADEIIEDVRQSYNQVLDAISTAKERIEETRAEEGYSEIEFAIFDTMLIQAKQTLMSNDFDSALRTTQDCLSQLEDAKKPIYQQLVFDVEERFKILGSEVMSFEPQGIDVAESKELMVEIQESMTAASDYASYSRVWWDMDKMEDTMEDARREYALLSDIPRFLTYKLKDAKLQLVDMKEMGATELDPLYSMLDECLEDYALAGTDEEFAKAKDKVASLVKDIYKARDSSVAMKGKREAIEKILNTALNGIRKLKDEGYEVTRLEQELDNKHNLIENAKTMKGLDFLHDEVGKWVTGINDIFEEEAELFNQKETSRSLIVEVNKHYKKLQGEDVSLSEIKPKVELMNKMAPEANTIAEFKELTAKAQPLLSELETIYETALADKEKKEKASAEMEVLKTEVQEFEGKADLAEVTHSLTLGEVALVSKQYSKALEFIEQCKNEIEEIKSPQGSLVEVEISTENLQPNMWDQTRMVVKNTGKTVLTDLDINIEGPIEIRRIKPVERLELSQELTLDVGVMFKGGGKIPLDLRISAVRLFDGKKIEVQKDLWVEVAAGAAPAAREAAAGGLHTSAAPAPSAPVSQEDEIILKIEKLAVLKEKGIISEIEFEKKKKELLDQY